MSEITDMVALWHRQYFADLASVAPDDPCFFTAMGEASLARKSSGEGPIG